jgi:hypothetical protein
MDRDKVYGPKLEIIHHNPICINELNLYFAVNNH